MLSVRNVKPLSVEKSLQLYPFVANIAPDDVAAYIWMTLTMYKEKMNTTC